MRALFAVGLGVDEQDVGDGAVGDVELAAVEHIVSPSRRAVVRIEPSASEPAPGSVRPSAPILRPEQRSGRYLRRCASLPLR